MKIKNTHTKKTDRNTFQGKRFFLTIPHFDEIENVCKYLQWYKDGSLTTKLHEIPFFDCKITEFDTYKSTWKDQEYASSVTYADFCSYILLKDYAVVLETHTADVDKGHHLHVYIEFDRQREISPHHFDFLGKHGNLQKIRSEIAILQYMNKENEIRASFDVIDRVVAQAKSANEIKRLVFDLIVFRNWQPVDVNVRFGNRVTQVNILNLFKIAKQAKMDIKETVHNEWMKSNRMRMITDVTITKRLTQDELGIFNSFPIYQELVDVVNRILVKGNNHDHKQCTIALVGKPSIGKSSFANALAKYFPTYFFPLDGWHQGEYINGVYDIWLWHEWDFRIISKSDFLLLTEGEKCDLRVKFAKTVKTDRPLLILTSNDTFEEACQAKFKRDIRLQHSCIAALRVRIQEFDFGNLPLHFLPKLLVSVNEDI